MLGGSDRAALEIAPATGYNRMTRDEIAALRGDQAGDRLRVLVSPSADGYAYVLARNTLGEVSVLFPAAAMRGASRVRAGPCP